MIDPSPWRALGAELALARHRSACTQQQLARQLGISQAAYSHFERGRARPRPALLGRLAVALRADVARLAALAGYSLEQVLAVPVTRTRARPRQKRAGSRSGCSGQTGQAGSGRTGEPRTVPLP